MTGQALPSLAQIISKALWGWEGSGVPETASEQWEPGLGAQRAAEAVTAAGYRLVCDVEREATPPAPSTTDDEASHAPPGTLVVNFCDLMDALGHVPIEPEYAKRLRRATFLAQTRPTPPPAPEQDRAASEALAPVPHDQHERDVTEALRERDEAQEWADRLAYAVAPVEVIGEHSNLNSPWQNALDVLRDRGPAATTVAPAGDEPGWVCDLDHESGPFRYCHIKGCNWTER